MLVRKMNLFDLTGKVFNVASVNAIGPGLFETGMTENTLFKSEKFLNGYNMLNPSNRPGRKGEVNGTVLYLSSGTFSYIQGQFIVIDGGGSLV